MTLLSMIRIKKTILKPIEQLAPGIVFGLGLGIIIACIYFHLIFDLQDLSGQVYFIYTILIIWSLIAVGLIIQGIRKNNEMAAEIVMGLQMALPIFFGIILILFGIFLIGFEKLIETIIETFLGGILIVYGIQNVKNQRTQNLIIIGLIILAFIITIVFSLYIN